MKKTVREAIFGEDTRPVRRVSPLELVGKNYSKWVWRGYGVYLHDEIVFPERIEDFEIYLQPISVVSDKYLVHIAVIRNGKPGYVSLGALYKMQYCGVLAQNTCEFGRRLGEQDDDYERVRLLVANHLCCKEMKEGTFVKREVGTGREIRPLEVYSS